jgi:hypothetical protein
VPKWQATPGNGSRLDPCGPSRDPLDPSAVELALGKALLDVQGQHQAHAAC